MMRLLTACLLLCSSIAFGQGKLNFSSESFDFGQVPEGKVASHEYDFVNTGTAPIIISHVQAACGCTTPFWTKEPIMPGQKGVVKASFNSIGRPGAFSKTVTVNSNASEPTKVLSFRGTVIARGQTPSATDEQKANSATLVYDHTEANLGKLEPGQSAVARFTVTNKGKSDLEIYDASSTSYSTSWSFSKPALKPGEKGVLEITYKAPQKPGPIDEVVTVSATDYNNYFTKLRIRAQVVAPATSSVLRDGPGVPFK